MSRLMRQNIYPTYLVSAILSSPKAVFIICIKLLASAMLYPLVISPDNSSVPKSYEIDSLRLQNISYLFLDLKL